MPCISWSPNLNTNGEVRVYIVLGKTNLTDAAWVCPANAAHRFFKVKVEMPWGGCEGGMRFPLRQGRTFGIIYALNLSDVQDCFCGSVRPCGLACG